MPVAEVETAYGARPEGSESKLSTWRDGWRIMRTIGHLFRIERPVLFYGSFGLALAVAAVVLAVPLAITYAETGLVPRFPQPFVRTRMRIVAALGLITRLLLDPLLRRRHRAQRTPP